ncbi:uncharacterized protein LOC143913201 [Arctopsyche grandis]|uniref:uncharacterized protein LOC143913201 n=1 Tax=Arctopsyche grandis TaxID=121162 RepID=UPI00406D9BFD
MAVQRNAQLQKEDIGQHYKKENTYKNIGLEWSRHHTVTLIRALKKNEILWNSSSKNFKDRRKKAQAWESIECEVGIPVDLCKRRVESLFASCRREKNKILKSQKVDEPDDLYQPKWVYWKEFNFLRGLPDEDNADLPLEADEEALYWSPSARRPPRNRKKAKLTTTIKSNGETCILNKRLRPKDEYDAFGITIAAKLRRMDENQRLMAENIVNQIMYKGLRFQLSPELEAEFMQPRMQQNDVQLQLL